MKNFKSKINKFNQKQKGFVLLFSVLISTLVLAVGISIISIALKQVVLSGAGRDSQYAFYASNTGAECAFYWDLKDSVFATSSESVLNFDIDEVRCLGKVLAADEFGTVLDNPNNNCVGDDINTHVGWCVDAESVGGSSSETRTKFRIRYDDRPYCADVIVTRHYVNGELDRNSIYSRGYNTCDENNPRRIERGLEFSY